MQPDMLASALHALQLLLEPARLLFLCIGVVIGLAIGVLPGLNGIVGMAMLIPFTYNLDELPHSALLLGMAAVVTWCGFHHSGPVGHCFTQWPWRADQSADRQSQQSGCRRGTSRNGPQPHRAQQFATHRGCQDRHQDHAGQHAAVLNAR